MTYLRRTWDDLTEDERVYYPPEMRVAVLAILDLAASLEIEDSEGESARRFAGLARALDGQSASIAEWRAANARR